MGNKKNEYQVILSKSEYDDLCAKADYNVEQIEQKALNLWKWEGRVNLNIDLNLRSARTDINNYDSYTFDSYAYLSERGKFTIPSELRERLRVIITGYTKSLMEKSFGEHLTEINNIINLENQHERMIKRYKIFTLTGWAVGILAVVAAAIL